jgi:adenylyltransferase/sulfurtransferase
LEHEYSKHSYFFEKSGTEYGRDFQLLNCKSPILSEVEGRGFRVMNSITAIALKQKIDSAEDFQLIDVREPYEHEEFNIGGQLIPLNEIAHHIDEIATKKPVIIYCRKGIRSQIAIQRLQEKFPFTNLINLIGGTEAWKQQFGV